MIAGVLERVDAALVALVTSPATGMSDLRSAVDLLTDTLLSHLSYEEGELVEPLGRLGPALHGSAPSGRRIARRCWRLPA